MEPFRLSHDMYMLLPAGASDLSCPQALSLWPRREKRFVPSGVAFGFCLAVPISWASSICFHLSHTIVIYPYYKGVWELSALLLPQDPNFRKPPHIKKNQDLISKLLLACQAWIKYNKGKLLGFCLSETSIILWNTVSNSRDLATVFKVHANCVCWQYPTTKAEQIS